MKYYQLLQDIELDYGIVESPRLPRSTSGHTESFLAGQTIKLGLPNPLVFIVDNPINAPPLHLLGDTIPVFSDLLIHALRDAGIDNFEVFPALLRNPATGQEWKGYQAFNAIGIVDAANETASVSDLIMPGGADPGQVPALVSYTTLVLDLKKARNLLMFRLATSPSTLLIHERVFAVLRAKSPPGGWGISAKVVDAT